MSFVYIENGKEMLRLEDVEEVEYLRARNYFACIAKARAPSGRRRVSWSLSFLYFDRWVRRRGERQCYMEVRVHPGKLTCYLNRRQVKELYLAMVREGGKASAQAMCEVEVEGSTIIMRDLARRIEVKICLPSDAWSSLLKFMQHYVEF